MSCLASRSSTSGSSSRRRPGSKMSLDGAPTAPSVWAAFCRPDGWNESEAAQQLRHGLSSHRIPPVRRDLRQRYQYEQTFTEAGMGHDQPRNVDTQMVVMKM